MSDEILTEQQTETFLSGDPMTVALAASHEALRADRDRLAAHLAEVERERDAWERKARNSIAATEDIVAAEARVAGLEAALHVASGRVRWLHRVAAVDWAPDEKAALVRDLNLIDAALAPGGES